VPPGKALRRIVSESRAYLLLAALSLAVYIILGRWFPLGPNVGQIPSPDIRTLAPTLGEAALYALLLIILYGLYLLAYKKVIQAAHGPPILLILALAALYCLPLIFSFPVNTTDIYRYFIRGRISSVYGESPYLVTAADLDADPFAKYAGEYTTATTPYGPLWELVAMGTTSLSPDNLYPSLVLFKTITAAAHLAAAGLVALSLSGTPPARRAGQVLLYAWNPALLLIFAMNGHNDSLMLLWLLLGWWVMSAGRRQAGMILMLLAPLSKPIGLLPLPFFFLSAWKNLPGRAARLRFLLTTVLGGLALVWLTFAPFGSPLSLASRLAGEAGSGGGFSPLALIILQARAMNFNPSIRVSVLISAALFVLLTLGLLWLTYRGRSPLRAAADIFGGYIVQAFRFRIWYTAWPFPWLVLDHGRQARPVGRTAGRLAAGLTFLLASQLSVLIYGHIRTEFLMGSMLGAHWLGVAFTFLLPLIAGLGVGAYSARSHEHQKEK
jgi:hypothetical protein